MRRKKLKLRRDHIKSVITQNETFRFYLMTTLTIQFKLTKPYNMMASRLPTIQTRCKLKGVELCIASHINKYKFLLDILFLFLLLFTCK